MDVADKIEKRGEVWSVLSLTGEVLGEHATEGAALEQLRAIEAAKAKADAAPAKGDVFRVDRLALRIDAGTLRRLDNGMVEAWGVATRVGVFDYDAPEMPGGVFREYRPPEEVMDAESVATLIGVPFTIDHPPDGVTSSNATDLTHGWVLDVRPDGDLIHAKVRIASDAAQAAIKAGMVELSCGYRAQIDDESGTTPKGEPYDGVQRKIRYNHLALVDFARAGHVARLRMDGLRVQREPTPREQPMKIYKLHMDGKVINLPQVLALGLIAAADEPRGDAIETANLTIESGGESVTLVLPVGMVEEINKMLGITPASEAATPAMEPAAPPAEAPPAEAPPADKRDEDPPAEDPEKKMDNAKIEVIAKRIAAAEIAKYDGQHRERAAIERQASRVLDSGYTWDRADTLAILADVVAKVDPARADEAKALAKVAKADERARGRLDGMFADAIRSHRDAQDSSGGLMVAVTGATAKVDAGNKITAARDAMRARRAGKPTDGK